MEFKLNWAMIRAKYVLPYSDIFYLVLILFIGKQIIYPPSGGSFSIGEFHSWVPPGISHSILVSVSPHIRKVKINKCLKSCSFFFGVSVDVFFFVSLKNVDWLKGNIKVSNQQNLLKTFKFLNDIS